MVLKLILNTGEYSPDGYAHVKSLSFQKCITHKEYQPPYYTSTGVIPVDSIKQHVI